MPRWFNVHLVRAGYIVWTIASLAVLIVVGRAARPATVLEPAFEAVAAFWTGAPVYTPGIHGFIYLPSSLVLFSPFTLLGPWGGGIAWRLLSATLLAVAAIRAARVFVPGDRWHGAAMILPLLMPTASGVLANGQFEGPMLALLALAAADIADNRWRRAALIAGLAVGLKPIAVVFVLLAAAVWPAYRWVGLGAAAATLALPFVNPDWSFVVAVYHAAYIKLSAAGAPGIGAWNDVHMLLTVLGVRPPDWAMTMVRVAAAIATVGLAARATSRNEHVSAVLLVFALAQTYQLLFNPRTEGLSYVNLGFIGGTFAARALLLDARPKRAAAIAAMCLAMGMTGLTRGLLNATRGWFRATLCIVFVAGVLIPDVWRSRLPRSAERRRG